MFRIKYLAVALAVSSGSAMAAADFQGFYGQFGVGYEGFSPSQSGSATGAYSVGGNNYVGSTGLNISPSSSNGFTGNFGIGYMQKITKGFLLGIGAEYSPIQGQSSSSNVSTAQFTAVNPSNNTRVTIPGIVNAGQFSTKKENSYNIFISPALTVGDDSILYGKIGYSSAKFKVTDLNENSSLNLNGYLLGLGVKHVITGGLYGFVEGNYVKHQNKTVSGNGYIATVPVTYSGNFGGSSYNLMAGIGYKF